MSNPLGEIFGFPSTSVDSKALRYRNQKLCPYNNRVPNCTKDKANNPLGVCSIKHNDSCIITCPIRFREEWIIAEQAAQFFFGGNQNWTTLSEVRLLDDNGNTAGNIDYVLVSYDDNGRVLNFGSLEVQGVYISGNLREPFEAFLQKPTPQFEWPKSYKYPKPDFLSSSRKRLLPQLLYKGGILHYWKKKQAVALQKCFFDTLPPFPQVPMQEAEIAWCLYDLIYDGTGSRYKLSHIDTIYTAFEASLMTIITPSPGNLPQFINSLQDRLNETLEQSPPDAPTLNELSAE